MSFVLHPKPRRLSSSGHPWTLVVPTLCLCVLPDAAAFAQIPTVRDPETVLTVSPPAPDDVPPPPPVVQPDVQEPAVEPMLDVIFERVRVVGATVLSESAITAPFAGMYGRRPSVRELRTALDEVNRLYRDAGYALGRAIIPGQSVQGGVLTVRVVEGYVGEIKVEAETEDRRQLVLRFGDEVLAERPLTARTLQRYLLTLRDIPGLTVGSRIAAFDANTGAATLAISADLQPFSAQSSFDHRARLEGLPFQLFVGGSGNNLFGWGDQLTLVTLATDDINENHLLQGSYSAMVGSRGARILVNGSLARFHADEAVPGIVLISSSQRMATNFSYPLILTPRRTLSAAFGGYYAQSEHEFSGVTLLEDEILALVAEAQYFQRIGEDWYTNVLLRLTQGLDLFGVGDGPLAHTRPGAPQDFTKLRATASMTYRATERLSLIFSADAQYSPVSLLSAEEIAFGGSRFGRGYEQAEISGDRGYALSFQTQYRFPIGSSTWSLMPYAFVDYAQAFNTPSSGQPSADLLSTGVGTWISRGQSVSVGLEADKPLTRTPRYQEDKDWRFFFMLRYKL